MNIGCCIATKDIPLAKEFGYDYVELSAKEIMKMDTELWKLKRKEILHPGIPVLGLSAFADAFDWPIRTGGGLECLFGYIIGKSLTASYKKHRYRRSKSQNDTIGV